LQSLVLLGGSIFAWWTIYHDFVRFFDKHYVLTNFTDCVVPNPLATPCFYGGICFVLALAWSVSIWLNKSAERQRVNQARIWWLLLAGTIFAWSNFGYQYYKFVQNSFRPTLGCSATIVQTPWQTSCFYGAAIFLTALVVASIIKFYKNRNR